MKVRAAIAPEVVIKRINRKLAEDGLAPKKARGTVAQQLVDYFLVADDNVARCNINLEKVAREKGAIQEWETVAC